MAGFKIGDVTVDLDQPMRVREVCEAEKALGMGMGDSGTARVAVFIFVALRKLEPDESAALLADRVMDMDLAAMEDADLPPLPVSANGQDPESPPTSGPPLSDLLESRSG